jgi:catechol-2,3-dioxygenase
MKIKSLGHVVIRVRNLERSEAFYRDVLGLPVCAHYDQDGLKMAFFTLGDHHDFAIAENPDLGEEKGSGLDHVAFKIGTDMDDLRAAKAKMDEHGIATDPIDHDVTKSLYIADPDGNGIELYIDYSDGWKTDPNRLVDTLEPLAL